MEQPRRFLLVGVIGELSLGAVGAALAWLGLGRPFPFRMGGGAVAVLLGFAAACPPALLVALALREGRRVPALRRGLETLIERLRPVLGTVLRDLPWWGISLLSLAAGFGEEILFRGVLQPWIGLYLASLIFGLLHALSLGFFLFATAMGLYLGGLYHASGALLVPILAHAVYDVFALYMLRRFYAVGA